MSEKKIDLIAQLLAKAESTTPEEAEALTEAAERLMVKHMIDQATIDARRSKSGKTKEQIVERSMEFKGAYRLEMEHLAGSVMYGLGGLRGMKQTHGNKSITFWVIGFESDVDQAYTLIQSLHIQATVAVRSWWREHKSSYAGHTTYEQEAARRSFMRGFGTGAGKRILDSKSDIVAEATSGTELVLVNRDAEVQEHMDGKNTRKGRAHSGRTDGSAMGRGYAAGQKANTGGTAVGQRGRITA